MMLVKHFLNGKLCKNNYKKLGKKCMNYDENIS